MTSGILSYFLFLSVGRLCIFLLQKFPFYKFKFLKGLFLEGGFLHDLFACDLCLGVWVFTILSAFFRLNLLEDYFYIPVVSEFITGGITSFIAHLIRSGYQAQYSVIEVH
jgi:hypothetical protein